MGGDHTDQSAEAKAYLLVFLSLIVLTVVTVGVSFIDFGYTGDIVVGLAIACVKAYLVVAFFMHLKHEDGVILTYAIYPIILLAILMVASLSDDIIRGPSMEKAFETNGFEHEIPSLEHH